MATPFVLLVFEEITVVVLMGLHVVEVLVELSPILEKFNLPLKLPSFRLFFVPKTIKLIPVVNVTPVMPARYEIVESTALEAFNPIIKSFIPFSVPLKLKLFC